ncbi:hypothetical protein B0H16DRAFT_1820981, partial [Mycena metata]
MPSLRPGILRYRCAKDLWWWSRTSYVIKANATAKHSHTQAASTLDPISLLHRLNSHDPEGWLSQANHVFSRLQITSNLEDYGASRKSLPFSDKSVYFIITVGNAGQGLPPGYLFLCPPDNFRTGPTSFKWPNRPAYWSLDPDGIEVLSTEEAERLGFPPFRLATEIKRMSWDASVYAGLRKFHQAKGFDPDSQD